MNLLFITDPINGFNLDKDSSLAMMRQAQQRGHAVWVSGTPDLQWQRGVRVSAVMQRLHLKNTTSDWYQVEETQAKALCEMDAVLMRKDPPFDSEYFYATHLLSQAQREGAKVFNHPSALREHPEKLALMEFAEWTTPTLVTRQPEAIRAFHALHHDIILKPLDGMGGMGIFRVRADGLNLGSIIETLNGAAATSVMVQKFVPDIAQGDKRVLVIGGQPVPYALARIPQGNEVRGNLAAGGKGVAQPLTDRDRQIALAIGPTLAARGLLLVGLDIIGDSLTEVNVTSPTCFREITDQTGFDVAAMFMDALELALQSPIASEMASAR